MVRMIATARIVMPKAMVRLSAGRVRFSQPEQVNSNLYPLRTRCSALCISVGWLESKEELVLINLPLDLMFCP